MTRGLDRFRIPLPLALLVLMAALLAPRAAKAQECYDCYQYYQYLKGTFIAQAQCCIEGTNFCDTLASKGGSPETVGQSGCFIENIEDGYQCDASADFPCNAGGGGGDGGGGGGGCTQGPGEWCEAACMSCRQAY